MQKFTLAPASLGQYCLFFKWVSFAIFGNPIAIQYFLYYSFGQYVKWLVSAVSLLDLP
jgi:hypothetical protein